MTIFIEPFRNPNEHMTFLVSLLSGELAQNKKIVFLSSKEYFNSIPEEFRNKIEWKKINKVKSSLKIIFKIVVLSGLISYKYRNEKGVKIFLLSSKSYSNLLLKIYSLFFIKNIRLYVFLHGELQNIISKESVSHRFDGLIQTIVYKFDSLFKTNLKFVVISQFVYEKLSTTLNSKLSNFISINLPYYYNTSEIKSSLMSLSSSLTISTVGVNSYNKNSHYLNLIAEKFIDDLTNKKLKLAIIGRNENIVFNEYIDVPNFDGELLTPEVYSNRILQSDFLVFFNEDNKYNLISSGSYFDCIKYNRPMLALKNSQWEYNFKTFGEIGYLCEDLNEMYEIIQKLTVDKRLIMNFNEALEVAKRRTDIQINMTDYVAKFE